MLHMYANVEKALVILVSRDFSVNEFLISKSNSFHRELLVYFEFSSFCLTQALAAIGQNI